MTITFRYGQTTATMLQQIGAMTVLGVSGGRWRELEPGVVELPVRYGYRVEVAYDEGRDTYTVRRRWVAGARQAMKGEITDVHAGELPQVVWLASCYRDPFG